MKKLQYIILIAVAALFTSCLDKLPEDAVPEKDAMHTLTDADQIINGIYASFKGSGLYTGDMTLAQDIQADLVYAVDGFSNSYGQFWKWDIKPENRNVTNVYASLYGIIGQCNFFLEKAPKVEESLVTEKDFATFDVLVGEAHFARALAYSELVRIFCKAYSEEIADDPNSGVVLSTTYTEVATPERSTLRESYDLILDDLSVAEGLITGNQNNSVFFTQGTVEALYSRVYLNMQEWEKAVDYSSRVIERSTTYDLAAHDRFDGSTGYNHVQYMWTHDVSYEIIWKVGLTENSLANGIGQVFLNYNYVTYMPDYVPAQSVINSYSSSDARAAAYFTSVRTGYAHGLTWPLLSKYKGNADFLLKNIMYVHMPKVFRLAEVYLNRAEAHCRLGNYSAAANDLSTLSSARTGMGSVSLSADNWLSKISEERVRELYMEGFRLNDLKRWGMGFERKAQLHTVAPDNTLKIAKDDHRFVWPIPQHEIEAPGSMIVQNEGY